MVGKIFGIGMSRTGTTSLNHVLENMGYRCFHFVGALMADSNSDILDDVDVAMDSPIPLLFPQLDKKYPNSKFILTTRNKDSWLESMHWLFTHGKVIWNWPKSTQAYHRKFYGTIKYDKNILSNHYDLFHQKVFEYFKDRPRDLLVINIDRRININDICDYLDKPRINIQFPKTNERQYASIFSRVKYSFNRILDPH
jgi:hypothetical protein